MDFVKKETRFARKLEDILWWIIRLFPLIFIVVMMYASVRAGTANSMPTEVSGSWNFYGLLQNSYYIGLFSNNFFYNLFARLFGQGSLLPLFNTNPPLSGILFYVSYLCAVEVVRFFVDFILAIPRIMRKLIEKWC